MHRKLLSLVSIAKCVLAGYPQYSAYETESCSTTTREHNGYEYTITTSAKCSPETITISGPVNYCKPSTVTTTCSETVTSCSKSDYCHPTTATVIETSSCHLVTTTLYSYSHGPLSTTTVYNAQPGHCVPSTTTLYSDKLSTTTVYNEQPCQSSTQTATSISYITATREVTLPASTTTITSSKIIYRDSTTTISSLEARTSYSTKTITQSVPLCGGGTTYINSYNATIISISTQTLASTTLTSTLYSSTTLTETAATRTIYSTDYSTTNRNVTILTTSYFPSPTTITAGNGTITRTEYFPSFLTTTAGSANSTDTIYFPSGTATITSYILSTTTIRDAASTQTQYFPSIITVTAGNGNVTATSYIPSGTATITSFYPDITTVTEPGSTRTVYLPSNDTSRMCCNNTGGGGGGAGTNGSDIYALLVGYLESTYLNLVDQTLTNTTDSITNRISLDLRNFFETNPINIVNANISLNSTDLSYLNRTIAGVLYNYMQYQFEDRSSPVNQSIRVEINETPWWAIVLIILLIIFGLLILAGLIWLIFFRRTHVCRGKKSLHGGKEVVVCAVDGGNDIPGGGDDEICQRCQKPRSICGCDQGPLLSS